MDPRPRTAGMDRAEPAPAASVQCLLPHLTALDQCGVIAVHPDRGLARESRAPVLCNIDDIALAKESRNKVIGLQGGLKKFDGPNRGMREADLPQICGRAGCDLQSA